MTRSLTITVVALGVVAVALGIVFIVNVFVTQGQISESLRAEQVTLGIPENPGDVVDTAREAQVAQGIIEEHLRENYGTYGDTERGSAERDSYLDGTPLRNSLNLALMGFGISQMLLSTGTFMVLTGIALSGSELVTYRLSRRVS